MSEKRSLRTIFLAPTSGSFGASAVALGLIRAYQREGYTVSFVKPVADFEATTGALDRSVHFARTLCGLVMADPIPACRAEEMVRSGNEASLLEEVVALIEAARGTCDVAIVEGISPHPGHPAASELNLAIARNIGAGTLAVVHARHANVDKVVNIINDVAHRYGGEHGAGLLGAIVSRTPNAAFQDSLRQAMAAVGAQTPLIGLSPDDADLTAPRLMDVAQDLGFTVHRPGDVAQARVRDIVVAARGPEKLVASLRPGTLVVLPGDRSDLVLTAVLARAGGMPIAGLLLTCGEALAPAISEFLAPRFGDLPILTTELQTYDVAVRLSAMDRRVELGDHERMERIMDHIADHLDLRTLINLGEKAAGSSITPPMFRHRLIQQARQAGRRIVLPEGDEPRTIRAAAICAAKGIARCVLLGDPEHIRSIAKTHGIDLPEDLGASNLEILNPLQLRESYVAPMVNLRKAKGLTEHQAALELEDNVVLGTMMLAVGDVDGLVSGAVHTTASTVRPALQLIKTAPGASIVSSVFFMLMPDQVLVYGDCAINPNPSADALADIAMQSADSAAAFGLEPRVAMISYSTGSSGVGADVDKVRQATDKVRQARPELVIDGPIQYDAASVESVGRQKAPGSPLDGQANVFIFPDLNTGNTTYKAVQRSANVVSIGPMLQGLNKPVNDLSRGARVDDIVYTIALTAIQAGRSR